MILLLKDKLRLLARLVGGAWPMIFANSSTAPVRRRSDAEQVQGAPVRRRGARVADLRDAGPRDGSDDLRPGR